MSIGRIFLLQIEIFFWRSPKKTIAIASKFHMIRILTTHIKTVIMLANNSRKPAADHVVYTDGRHFVSGTGYAWYKNNKIHRDDDLPARHRPNSSDEWYKNGERHRDGDLPAFDYYGTWSRWYQHGELHRDGLSPAIVWRQGGMQWYKRDVHMHESVVKAHHRELDLLPTKDDVIEYLRAHDVILDRKDTWDTHAPNIALFMKRMPVAPITHMQYWAYWEKKCYTELTMPQVVAIKATGNGTATEFQKNEAMKAVTSISEAQK